MYNIYGVFVRVQEICHLIVSPKTNIVSRIQTNRNDEVDICLIHTSFDGILAMLKLTKNCKIAFVLEKIK